jgi:hypothetical protein
MKSEGAFRFMGKTVRVDCFFTHGLKRLCIDGKAPTMNLTRLEQFSFNRALLL